jgi:hypothetical protein
MTRAEKVITMDDNQNSGCMHLPAIAPSKISMSVLICLQFPAGYPNLESQMFYVRKQSKSSFHSGVLLGHGHRCIKLAWILLLFTTSGGMANGYSILLKGETVYESVTTIYAFLRDYWTLGFRVVFESSWNGARR